MKLISWNVNGIRAALKKGFLDFVEAESPDVLLLQEVKFDTETECIDLCGETGGCYWSTYNPGSGDCRLLQTCSSFDATANVTSNYKKCAAGTRKVDEKIIDRSCSAFCQHFRIFLYPTGTEQ